MRLLLGSFLSLSLAGVALSHQAPLRDHAKIVPVSAYEQPYGEASGAPP